ncbi:MAG: YggS family pyridoxal phosphate-dependent enzyme [Ignavibacteriaceae bacterium]|nr:YggS family pyridoxal phosphate-dependent enzyme [Ignavibacteriaceae bacterium]
MIQENLVRLRAEIADACRKSGRNPKSVKLVGVSKMFPVPVLQEAYDAGLRVFGENKPQEFRDKHPQLPADIEWHLIGHLQSNKVKYVAGKVELIHSVDSVSLAEEINKVASRSGIVQKILIEVNTSGEESKIGLHTFQEVSELARKIAGMSSLDLRGLMTIGPNTADEDAIRMAFAGLRGMTEKLNQDGFRLVELSMGMTQDFEIAIEEGATIIRIGTALFGARNYK